MHHRIKSEAIAMQILKHGGKKVKVIQTEYYRELPISMANTEVKEAPPRFPLDYNQINQVDK